MAHLRVLHVVPALAMRYGGPSTATIGMCRALEAEGVRATIASTDADGQDRLPVPIGRLQDYEGVPSIFFEQVGPESFKWSPLLGRWLRQHVGGFDLVHIHAVLSHASLAAASACRRAGVPYLMRPLGTLDPWSLSQHAIRKRVLLALSGRRALRGAACMHYTSADEERRSRQALPWLPPGVVLPLGIDSELFTDGIIPEPKERPYVLALCRLDPKKGIDVLIRAFHEAGPRAPEWRLVIAGDGGPTYVAELTALAQSGAAASQITFCGWIDGEARRTWLRGATLFALPSLQENFGLSVVQAMAAGVPVIVSPGVGLASEIEQAEAGWCVPRDRFGPGLAAAMADRDACGTRGQRARRYAERFRWARVGRALVDVYATVQRQRHLETTTGPESGRGVSVVTSDSSPSH
jgi:glycosyltransferase involved in cell wall biosynthesis